jgi:CubicO group peptidase (beta-lactamase class C family)
MMRVSTILSSIVAVFLVASCDVKTEVPTQQPDINSDFEIFAEKTMKDEAVPGMALAVINEGEIISLKAYGYADIEEGRTLTIDTPMNIASISKPIMGIGLLQLVDKGVLDLDADINAYLPFKVDNPNTEGEKITVRHLASHASGIADFYLETDYTEGADSATTLLEHITGLLTPEGARYQDGKHYLNAMPGAAREYSNLAAGVAGAIAEDLSGQSLHEYMSESLFRPLGMDQTNWLISANAPDVLAVRYDKDNQAYPHYGNPNYPDGGVNASIRDLTTLTLSILSGDLHSNHKLLSSASFDEMLKLQLPEVISKRQRFFWRDRDGMTGHQGSDLGVATGLYFNPTTGDAIIILFNRDFDRGTSAVMKKIAERAHQDLLAP